ncbi:insecticidal toxin complex protein TccC [Pseudomonas laurylsulfativorans]|uniref:RHS repeat-associated core domain-containing protein n=1 Tax=Pseudomonas laurylsulfativorans TaxID=1943631 RepID=UPI00209C72CB|nr:RHS repeat-associated core domain-containing protein [Pseudomonas laurylsulfativorans]MCP1420223.1 insecticidal toxin complex protein TccC [Pseudomonas laurylsulfativorans]
MAAAQWIDAHTPSVSVVDSRGLAVRSVAYCRHPLNPSVDARITRNHFDAAGRLVASWDPRLWGAAPKPNLATTHDLQSQPLLVDSVDAGWQLSLQDQTGTARSFWDGRGSQRHTEYDELQRPTIVTEQMKDELSRVSERFAYGVAGEESAFHNQCGKLIRHDHPAGRKSLCEYGVGGLLLLERTRFMVDLELPDWSSDVADARLEGEVFQTTQQYGPSGDMRSQTDAMDNVRFFAYDRAGQLREARLMLAGSLEEPRLLVSEIHYDAFGRGISERAGNAVVTTARYAGEDGRLLQLLSCDAEGQPFQDLNYGYDPAGNITNIEDKAQQTRHFNGQRIDPVNRYCYDSLYQLIEARGREVSQPRYGLALPLWQTTPLDPNQLRNYTQSFNYDAAGNLQTRHHSGVEAFEMFTSPDSNRSVADKENLGDGFDASGNQLELLRGQRISWDIRNQLSRVTMVQREDGPDDTECYFYDSPGHRLRKVRLAESASRRLRTEVRYLPGLEIHRDTATGEERYVVSVEAGRSQVRALHWVTKLPVGARNDQLRYCLSDHLNSSTLELDEVGGLLSWEVYYAFGGTALWAGSSEIEGKYKTIRYSGKERDATGLYYYGYRYYAPWLQRWISTDPAGLVNGLNVFCFVANSPVRRSDVDGRFYEGENDLIEHTHLVRGHQIVARGLEAFQREHAEIVRTTLQHIGQMFGSAEIMLRHHPVESSSVLESHFGPQYRSVVNKLVENFSAGRHLAEEYQSKGGKFLGVVMGDNIYAEVNKIDPHGRIALNVSKIDSGLFEITLGHELLHLGSVNNILVVGPYLSDHYYLSRDTPGFLGELGARYEQREQAVSEKIVQGGLTVEYMTAFAGVANDFVSTLDKWSEVPGTVSNISSAVDRFNANATVRAHVSANNADSVVFAASALHQMRNPGYAGSRLLNSLLET